MSRKRPVHVEIVPRKNESFEKTLKRFKKKVKKEGVIERWRLYQYYEKPSIKKRRKKELKKRLIRRIKAEEAELK